MIKIICVGKIKEKFYRDAIDEYTKRLSKYTKLEIIEVNDEEINSLEKEKENILKVINKKDYIITLEIEGTMLNSIDFSKKIQNTLSINPNITFIIGGSNGLHHEIKDISNYKISFSLLTFPHQLFRVILLEQIYRSYKIINNETYHK
ncbi:MAG: 23S rRNA (pseudouridine(1915)-N(3))-methyltransferase RlmH [Clostridium sp.]|nr:23S rRNA (pseudouridine(1915)-N(3))-methyltransferase RlmH [Clostridium sp.]MCM1443743.1 23S rRNA (pseudouridine(1915)-N(3))-methyltransferase RlmH [Candidatus Amulumruptor caecigallinarius]